MSHRYGTSLQPGAFTYGRGGLGIPADLVPATGLDGPAYFFDAVSLPADAGIEISARVTRWPVLGTLTLIDDEGRFTYAGETDYALYELRAWDVLVSADIGYGPGIGRVDFVIGGGAELGGGLTLGEVIAAGSLSGQPPQLTGDAALDPAAPAGVFSGGAPSVLSGDAALGPATPGGALVGDVSAVFYQPSAPRTLVVRAEQRTLKIR